MCNKTKLKLVQLAKRCNFAKPRIARELFSIGLADEEPSNLDEQVWNPTTGSSKYIVEDMSPEEIHQVQREIQGRIRAILIEFRQMIDLVWEVPYQIRPPDYLESIQKLTELFVNYNKKLQEILTT